MRERSAPVPWHARTSATIQGAGATLEGRSGVAGIAIGGAIAWGGAIYFSATYD